MNLFRIDAKRLKEDLNYWNSLAPPGATHYIPSYCDWYSVVAGCVPQAHIQGEWKPAGWPKRLDIAGSIVRRPAAASDTANTPPKKRWVQDLIELVELLDGYGLSEATVASAVRDMSIQFQNRL